MNNLLVLKFNLYFNQLSVNIKQHIDLLLTRLKVQFVLRLVSHFVQLRALLLTLCPAKCANLKRLVHITCFLFFVIAPLSLSAQIPSYVPTSGLVGWWPFNGNANDECGNGNNGTVNGATLTTDRFGVANKA
jgi:hypothetical protein